MSSSLTSDPAAMIAATSRPSGVSSRTACRRMSPVEMWGTRYRRAILTACVPFPDPGGPISTRFSGNYFNACLIAASASGAMIA